MGERKSTGVGRGNGAGSRKTQFKEGMPSGNPKGRPRKPKVASSMSLAEAARKVLSEMVTVQLGNGREQRMTRYDANMKKLASEFPHATFREKLAYMKMFSAEGMIAAAMPFEPAPGVIEDIVEQLAEEARREEELRGRFAQFER